MSRKEKCKRDATVQMRMRIKEQERSNGAGYGEEDRKTEQQENSSGEKECRETGELEARVQYMQLFCQMN